MRRASAVLVPIAFLFSVTSATAKSDFLEKILLTYKISDSGSLAERSCGICHVSDSDYGMNSYGKQLAVAMAEADETSLTAAIMKKIEAMDADGDGFTNAEELRADKAPGDSKDKPAGTPKPPPAAGDAKPPASGSGSGAKPPATGTTKPPTGKTEPATTEGGGEGQPQPGAEEAAPPTSEPTEQAEEEPVEEPEPPKRLIPKNGFHPAVVHFPIALFIAGLLLDLWGLLTKKHELLWAGWYNLVLAALSAVIGVVTGYLAMIYMKIPFKGVITEHFLFAVTGAFVMWMMVSMRVHRHEDMHVFQRLVYWLLAVIGLVLISWAGHLGGVFVYGE